MELSVAYENQPEDIIALIRYQLINNKKLNRRRLIVTTIMSFLLIGLGFLGNKYFDSIWFIYAFTFLTAILVFGSHLAHKQMPARVYKNQYARKAEQTKRYRITVKKSGLLVKSGATTNKHIWDDYVNYVLYGDYLLLFNKKGSAHVIPKRDIEEDIFVEFFNEISKKVPNVSEKKRSTPPSEVKQAA